MARTLIHKYANTCPAQTSQASQKPVKCGALTVQPVMMNGEHAFGGEVSGIDWSQPVPEETVQQLINLQDKYAVLIFRNTGLDNAHHIAFSQQLGSKLETNPFFYGIENDRVAEPLLWDVSNINLDGSIVQPDSRRWHHSLGNALWHIDSSYHQERSKYSLLLSHGNLKRGGFWTHFADTRRAYADLPEETKQRLEGLVVEHDLWHSRRLGSPAVYKAPTERERALKPPAYHQLVQETAGGHKTLYLAAHAKRILGLDPAIDRAAEGASPEDETKAIEKSQQLIWELIDHCTQPTYVFSMEWLGGGDMVWWDNRACMHRANPYSADMTARDVRRSTVIDDGPLAWGVDAETREAAEGVNVV